VTERLDATVTESGLTHLYTGKVRNLYRTEDGLLVVVASDRISAYDHVLDTPIPDKGRILTAMTAWWFAELAGVVPHHLVSVDDSAIPAQWRGRAMLCRPLQMLPVECVARGYLTGSGLAEYRTSGSVCGIALPEGLGDGSRLPDPIFTPTTKAPLGQHDTALTFTDVVAAVGADRAAALREVTLTVYRLGAARAEQAGVLLADSKFEFGLDEASRLVLADEVLTPDSSRFWPADEWHPGRAQPSFDKQYVRDWLTSPASGWDRDSGKSPPPLPDDVVAATRERYVTAYERITGLSFADWLC
jgi:phosphoribosylaminoimidazole-succinocarboxamide synthase